MPLGLLRNKGGVILGVLQHVCCKFTQSASYKKGQTFASSTAVRSEINQSKARDKDSSSEDRFFAFTKGRWVVDEEAQLARRYVRYDLAELGRVAAAAVGAKTCIDVQKYTDGQYNKTLLMTMDDNQQVVAKVPNPNAGLPYPTTASEVATMTFVSSLNTHLTACTY